MLVLLQKRLVICVYRCTPLRTTGRADIIMDLSGAYDSVCRELMFEKLQKLVGLSEHSLATLQ